LTRDEVLAQEQLSANDSVSIVDHPHLGKIRIVRAPPRFGGERLEPSRPTPAHGEHTDDVLASFGVTVDRIEALRSEGVLD
jgi:crotonobetainyl-CoA:carnitine CoA-transferase CaiB-like acyl-CoA transferase